MVNFFKPYKSRLFGIYWGRWMLSALVMFPFMFLFNFLAIPLWLNLLLGQSIGAIIFFKIDKWIFKGLDAKTTEDEYNKAVEAMNTIKDN